MNRFLLLLMLVLGTASVGQLQAQTFYEGFQQGIPATWTLYDVDGRTPWSPNVTFVDTAWVGWAEQTAPNDSFAVSTSWYNPAGAANDWLITPPIAIGAGELLKWKGISVDAAYLETYIVLISTTGNTIPDFTPVDTIVAEGDVWTSRYYDLAANGYENQTIYIAFRNVSNDKFLLGIDDVTIDDVRQADGRVNGDWLIEYSAVPLKQVQSSSFEVALENTGTDTLKNAYVNLQIYNLSSSTLEYNENSDTISLLSSERDTLAFPLSWEPTDTGTYVLSYLLISDNDANGANDTLFDVLYVTDTVYARDNGDLVSGLGLPVAQAVNGGYLGLTYEIVEPTALTSVEIVFGIPANGDSTNVSIYQVVNGQPASTPIAVSQTHYFANDTLQPVLFTFPDLVVLEPDTYLVAARQYSGYLSIYATSGKFSQGTHWLYLDAIANQFLPFEGITGIPKVSMWIHPNFGACPVSIDTAYVQLPSCPDQLDGYVIVEATPNYGGLDFEWNTGVTDSILLSLNAGVYTVSVSDDLGCQSVASYNLASIAPISVNVSTTNASTETSNDGEASVTATGGTAPYTYEWSNDSTGSTVTGLAAGIIRVTVTDANGCDEVAIDTIGFGVGIFNLNNDLSAKIYPNPATDKVLIEATLDKAGDVEIVILNSLGQAVIRQTETATQVVNTTVNISSLPAGIYLVQITSGDASSTQKLIVE